MSFNGKNTLGAFEGFLSRLNFEVNIDAQVKNRSELNAENSRFAKCIKDFRFAENSMYGKIDLNGMAVVLDPSENDNILKKAGSFNEIGQIFVVNFVADAFSDMEKYFKAARQNGKILLDDPYLSTPTPYKGYASFEDIKNTARQVVYNKPFIDFVFEMEEYTNQNLSSFHVFMNNFLFYVEQFSSETPFTKPEMVKNKFIPIRASGLVIELAEGDFSKDNPIDLLFYQNPNFDYYLNVAMKVGFSVDKNAPWRLVADLSSPTMRKYMANYNINGPADFFNNYCRMAHTNDFQEFIDFTLNAYAQYVDRKNLTARPLQRGDIVLTKKYNLEKLDETKVYQNYGTDYFLKKYIELKNLQNQNFVGKREMKVLKEEMNEILKLKQTKFERHNKISSIVDEKFKGIRGKGTLNDIKKTFLDNQRKK